MYSGPFRGRSSNKENPLCYKALWRRIVPLKLTVAYTSKNSLSLSFIEAEFC
jgi:hypothetical protein